MFIRYEIFPDHTDKSGKLLKIIRIFYGGHWEDNGIGSIHYLNKNSYRLNKADSLTFNSIRNAIRYLKRVDPNSRNFKFDKHYYFWQTKIMEVGELLPLNSIS